MSVADHTDQDFKFVSPPSLAVGFRINGAIVTAVMSTFQPILIHAGVR